MSKKVTKRSIDLKANDDDSIIIIDNPYIVDFADSDDDESSDQTTKSTKSTKSAKSATSAKSTKSKSIFIDDSDTSDSETDYTNVKVIKTVTEVKPIIGDKDFLTYAIPNSLNYNFKTWKECFPKGTVCLRKLMFNHRWNNFFNQIDNAKWYKNLETHLSNIVTDNTTVILPHAELVFNTLNVISPSKIRVVIIGQDPYPSFSSVEGKSIPNATGNSFSVPANHPKPKSLENIFSNLKTFGHIEEIPVSGCLSLWALQGCFMINSALTTVQSVCNAHSTIWQNFALDLIKYINDNCENVVFFVWGASANKVCKYVDPNKHCIITSSHPSSMQGACNRTLNGVDYGIFSNEAKRKNIVYPSFMSTNHFGRANDYLRSVGKPEILWDVLQ